MNEKLYSLKLECKKYSITNNLTATQLARLCVEQKHGGRTIRQTAQAILMQSALLAGKKVKTARGTWSITNLVA